MSGQGSTGDELWRCDATDLAALIRQGRVSAREAVDSCLGRVEAVNPALNAIVKVLGEEARAAAARADAAQQAGLPLGPLHGVPVTVKINIDQAGHATDNGILANRDLVATQDHPVVQRFREAGAIIIGRTNAPGYSMRWFTDNDLHGLTLNPFAPALTCGGSSGGAAAAVAAGMGAIAHGNDIAGSVRYPAYCCGLVGMRPGFGRVPAYNPTAPEAGSISSALMAVQGPLTRSVADNRLALAVMAGRDMRDPRWLPVGDLPAPAGGRRVALVKAGFEAPLAAPVLAALDTAAHALARAGYQVEEVAPPHLAECAALWPRIAMPDVIAGLMPLVEKNGDAGIRTALHYWREVWGGCDAEGALKALGRRMVLLRLWNEFLEERPLVLMPVSAELALPLNSDIASRDQAAQTMAAQAPLTAVSVLGLPGLSVPTGLHDGVPTGVQLVAALGREELCYAAGAVIEAHCPPVTPVDPRA